MSNNSTLPTEVLESFASLPSESLLATALGFQALTQQGKLASQIKELGECVTQADLELQKIIIDHFAASPLAGSYYLKSEEEIGNQNKLIEFSRFKWQLVIDPLDGTNSFAKGESDWGIMIGLCNLQGELLFSWNLISTGEIYSTVNISYSTGRYSNNPNSAEQVIRLDVFDYGATAIEKFPETFKRFSNKSLLSKELVITSLPSAVITAWEFLNSRIDGLVWVASDKGKRSYPDYDLIFTGALAQAGAQVGLGWTGSASAAEVIQTVVVARTVSEFEILWQTALSLLPESVAAEVICSRSLKITTPLDLNNFNTRNTG